MFFLPFQSLRSSISTVFEKDVLELGGHQHWQLHWKAGSFSGLWPVQMNQGQTVQIQCTVQCTVIGAID